MKRPSECRTLNDWLPWLESLSPREIVLGLERVDAVLKTLDLASPDIVFSVAGTNGKGSCVAMLERIVRAGGRRTGMYTSPHLIRYNERIQVNGVPASDEAIIAAFEAVETARSDIPLTYFEFGTLAALWVFADAGVDAWVLEVGMGGRLDAVNAITPTASLITNISLDHCAWLGDNIEAIAEEKAGIMRAGVPTVFGSPSVPIAIRTIAAERGAMLTVSDQHFSFEHRAGGSHWHWRGARLSLESLSPPALPGSIQLQNASAVLASLEAAGLDELLQRTLVNKALRDVQLRGRFQIIDKAIADRGGDGKRLRFILDVGHNPAAGIVLAEAIESLPTNPRIHAIVGMLADKDVGGFVAAMAADIAQWSAVQLAAPRAMPAFELARTIANQLQVSCRVKTDIVEALSGACASANDGDVILVTGSFFIVGPALEWLDRH